MDKSRRWEGIALDLALKFEREIEKEAKSVIEDWYMKVWRESESPRVGRWGVTSAFIVVSISVFPAVSRSRTEADRLEYRHLLFR